MLLSNSGRKSHPLSLPPPCNVLEAFFVLVLSCEIEEHAQAGMSAREESRRRRGT